jgi:flagellar hook-basal body complex protein FliE
MMQMSVESIGAAQAIGAEPASAVIDSSRVAPGFGQWFSGEVQALNQQMVAADRGVQQLAVGGAVNVHDVMIQLEQARLAFQLAIQVRSKVLEAYQDVMRMQV